MTYRITDLDYTIAEKVTNGRISDIDRELIYEAESGSC